MRLLDHRRGADDLSRPLYHRLYHLRASLRSYYTLSDQFFQFSDFYNLLPNINFSSRLSNYESMGPTHRTICLSSNTFPDSNYCNFLFINNDRIKRHRNVGNTSVANLREILASFTYILRPCKRLRRICLPGLFSLYFNSDFRFSIKN